MLEFLASVGRVFIRFLIATGRLTLFHPRRAFALRAAAVLFPAHPAADDRYRLLLAAGGRTDRDLHRHGAGAADLYRLLALCRARRGRDRRAAVDDARVGAGHRRR